jgi:hypothetical protein
VTHGCAAEGLLGMEEAGGDIAGGLVDGKKCGERSDILFDLTRSMSGKHAMDGQFPPTLSIFARSAAIYVGPTLTR